jgi:hypothetical protein
MEETELSLAGNEETRMEEAKRPVVVRTSRGV